MTSSFARTAASAFGKYAWIYPLLQLLVLVPIQWTRTDRDRDVVAYHEAAQRVERGESMYEPHPPPGPHVVDAWYYLYPPFLAATVSLVAPVSFVLFARLWFLVLLAAFWLYSACLCKLVLGRVTLHGTLVAGAALGLTPGLMHAINMGQADVLVWAMIGAGLAFPALRGAGFAAAALTKVHGVWPLATSLWREGSRVLLSAGVAVALAVVLAVAALGPAGSVRASAEWFRYVVPALGQGQFDPGQPSLELRLPFELGRLNLPALVPTNLSLTFAPIEAARRAGWWEYQGGQLPRWMRIYLGLAGVLAPLIAARVFRRRPPPLHYALVTAAAVLFSPIFKLTNLPLLLAPAAAALGARRGRPAQPSADHAARQGPRE
jgi:hypothetical protein